MADRRTIEKIQRKQLETGDNSVKLLSSAPPEFSPDQLEVHAARRGRKLAEIRARSSTRRKDEKNLNTKAFWRARSETGYTKVARGYAALTEDEAGRQREQWMKQNDHHLHVIDYLSHRRSNTAIADISAAIVWGIPIIGVPPDVVRRVSLGNIGTRRTRHQRTRRTAVPPEVVTIGHVTVTSIEQTIVDIACENGCEAALIAADFALHNQLTSVERITELASRQGPRPGINNIRSVLVVSDGRVESPAESRMRWRFHVAGFAVPEPQVIVIAQGKVYRVDGYDATSRTIYEADGKYKYALHENGQVQAFFDERNRDAPLRSLGFTVLRVQFSDVVDSARFEAWLGRYSIAPTRAAA